MSLFNLFTFDTLAHPWMLFLLAGVPIVLAAEIFAGVPGVVLISTGETLARISSHGRWLTRRIPALLRAAGLCCLIVALAGPLEGFRVRKDRANVIDIMLCVDVSGSMTQADFVSGGQYRDRLYVTKEAVHDFIQGRKEGKGDRFGMDRIGVVLFAGFAWTQCPLTLDYAVLEREIDLAAVDERDVNKQGTAIGNAIGLAVRRLSQSEAKSKVVILLTDGVNNKGELDPITAAQIAKEYDIRVYTIGAGTSQTGIAMMPGRGIAPREPIDEATMKRIAETTGAKYYRVTDTDALLGAYAEISAMETTEIEAGDYYEYKEGFMPFLLLGSLLVFSSIFTRRQWFEVIP